MPDFSTNKANFDDFHHHQKFPQRSTPERRHTATTQPIQELRNKTPHDQPETHLRDRPTDHTNPVIP